LYLKRVENYFLRVMLEAGVICFRCSFSASSEERVQQHIGKFHFVEDDDNAYDTNLEQPEQEPAEDSDSGMGKGYNYL
jgi:hypothetical protein